jgi:hypothetical protein
MAVVANSSTLYELVDEGAEVERLTTGFDFTEGTIYSSATWWVMSDGAGTSGTGSPR